MPDKLNATATQIDIKLTNNDCNPAYRQHMLSLFRDAPGFIDDVDPQYQSKLKDLINA